MQRVVKTLSLIDNQDLIDEYCNIHKNIWPEIRSGIKTVGVSAMDIYLLGNLLVMIIEAPDDIDLESAFGRLATMPRQQEWEEYVARFQDCGKSETSAQKWKMMSKIFGL